MQKFHSLCGYMNHYKYLKYLPWTTNVNIPRHPLDANTVFEVI